jgi:hypothetical protein
MKRPISKIFDDTTSDRLVIGCKKFIIHKLRINVLHIRIRSGNMWSLAEFDNVETVDKIIKQLQEVKEWMETKCTDKK